MFNGGKPTGLHKRAPDQVMIAILQSKNIIQTKSEAPQHFEQSNKDRSRTIHDLCKLNSHPIPQRNNFTIYLQSNDLLVTNDTVSYAFLSYI